MDDFQAATRDFLNRALSAKGWTAYRLAKEAGVSATTITRPLNNLDYKFVPKIETLAKIARAAEIELPDILKMSQGLDLVQSARSIPVLGEVRAGSWSTIPDEPIPEEWLQMEVPDYTGANLFGLRVVGRSMDLLYPDGSYVIVAPPQEAGVRVGDRVAVRRYDAAGKAETTLKEIVRATNGDLMLTPRSTDASLEAFPLKIDEDEQVQRGIEIIGVVVARYGDEKRGNGPLLRI